MINLFLKSENKNILGGGVSNDKNPTHGRDLIEQAFPAN